MGSDTRVMVDLPSKCLKARQDNEDKRPSVVERKREDSEELVAKGFLGVSDTGDNIDVGDDGRDEEGEDEGDNVRAPDLREDVGVSGRIGATRARDGGIARL